MLLTIEPLSLCVSSFADKKAGKSKKSAVSMQGRNLLNFIKRFSNLNSEYEKLSKFISWNVRNFNQFAYNLSDIILSRGIILAKNCEKKNFDYKYLYGKNW